MGDVGEFWEDCAQDYGECRPGFMNAGQVKLRLFELSVVVAMVAASMMSHFFRFWMKKSKRNRRGRSETRV